MKNTIFTAVLLGTLLFPSFSHAQEVQVVALTEEAKQALIAEITTKINELMNLLITQLKIELAQQITDSHAQTSQAITEVSNRVSSVEVATAPEPEVVVEPEPQTRTVEVGLTSDSLNLGFYVKHKPGDVISTNLSGSGSEQCNNESCTTTWAFTGEEKTLKNVSGSVEGESFSVTVYVATGSSSLKTEVLTITE